MSGRTRRAADGPPEGQPPAKKPLDINAIRAQIAAKKAAVEAKLAAREGTGSGSASPAPARDSPAPSGSSAAPGPASLPPKPVINDEMSARIAAAKARIDALKNKVPTTTPAAPANPYLKASGSGSGSSAPRPVSSGVALHPLLMEAEATAGQEKNEKKALANRYKTMAPKFSTVRANAAAVEEAHKTMLKTAPALAATTIVTNPYAPAPVQAAGPGPQMPTDGTDDGMFGRARERKSRKMQFSAPGKYVKQGDQLRNEIKLEELKQRIAAQSRKAGLDSEFDVLERSLKRQAPPTVEWWDEAIMPTGSTYNDIEEAEKWFRTSNDSLITHLVQHPIPIPAPSDRKETVRGLMLTKKEQKKMRRQRRQAELEEKRDKQRMGLAPPDPPKVRLANLMKVLTSDAVQDPTKVEAKVRREVAMRQFRHEQDNEERKLTPDQRAEKEYARNVAREAKGLFATAYIVRYLTNGRHKFKVRETAKHDMLSGLTLYHPDFAIVLVEGVNKKIKHYRQLMTHRIDWTEEARARGGGDDDESASGSGSGSDDEDAKKKKDGENGEDGGPDMAENKCEVLWEGEIPERTFKLFRARHAETDSAGKDWLTQKYEGVWDLAKKWTWQGEDL